MAKYIFALFLNVVILFPAVTAFAESTQVMLSACRPITKAEITEDGVKLPNDIKIGMCWGAFSIIQEVMIRGVCAPPESTRTQLITIFVNYAEKNPQRLHEDFFLVAIDSLKASFKCK